MGIVYDFGKKSFTFDNSQSPSRLDVLFAIKQASATLKPSFDNTPNFIAGTRTSATRLTRTAGTWTVDALIGKYVVAINADVSHTVFTIARIMDNTAAYVDIAATTYGDASLVSSADTVLIYDTLDAVFDDCTWVQI